MNSLVNKIKYIIAHEGVSSIAIRPYKIVIRGINSFLIQLFKAFPVNDKKVILESQGDYADNVRAFFDYSQTEKENSFNYIWLVQKPSYYRKKYQGTFVSRNEYLINIRAAYHIATAGYFIFSHPYWLKKWREKQVVINTTHSVAQLKSSPKGSRLYNYVLTCSDYCTEIRKKTFYDDCEDHFLCIGQPRLDLMYRHTECIHRLISKCHWRKIVLCMETFKQTTSWDDGGNSDSYAINVIKTADDLKGLDHYLSENGLVMIVKTHHLQDMSVIHNTNLDSILYLNDYELQENDIQINELLENADILLTDYSSVFYDYLLIDRPIGFLIGDINEYKRGFMMENPVSEMPGQIISNGKELISFLNDCLKGKDPYKDKRDAIRNKVFKYQDNNNSKRLMEWLIKDYMSRIN